MRGFALWVLFGIAPWVVFADGSKALAMPSCWAPKSCEVVRCTEALGGESGASGKLGKSAKSKEYVILLHGLSRTKRSMKHVQRALMAAGYGVVNVGYPSRKKSIAELADASIRSALAACRKEGASQIHFVAHSMGGILIRDYLSRHSIAELGRVVMLAPPNKGSELVDKLGKFSLFKKIKGPAAQDLSTHKTSTPRRLGPVDFPLGVIAGDRSINWLSSWMIPGVDDGKVSVESTRVDGMADHLVLHVSHPFIMRNKKAISQIIAFLKTGSFRR